MATGKKWIAIVVSAALLPLAIGCSPIYKNHGYVPSEADLAELVVGVDGRSTVDDLIGVPATSGMLEEGDYYYVRSQMKVVAFLRPEVVDRQVLAISFDETDTIINIERFGLKDGDVVPISRRVTDSSVVGKGFLRQLLGNFGNLNPTDFFD